jgi:regulator of replication initiation timing
MERLRNDIRELTDENASLRAEVSRLKSRSIWKRIMDK